MNDTDTTKLPARVQERITDLRRRSEVAIGWIQAAIITLFGALYFAAPKTFMADVPFQPVPWTLAIYALFTLLRLVLAYRRLLGPVMLGVSVVVDVALLMVLIWSFHLQYNQPAAFYLKAPSLLYIFIFIALRTLSFSPRYVLFTGVAAAIGWLLLLAIALMGPEGMALITRDYVAYMTSARILIGAEIDKVISILLVSVVLSAAVARSRDLLQSSVKEAAAANELSRFFEPDVAREIIGAEDSLKPGDGREAHAASMFIDLRGFTKLAVTMPAGEVVALLNEYHSVIVPLIKRNGGHIVAYLGDGILVTFGAIRARPIFAADALRAAGELLDAHDRWTEQRATRGQPTLGIGVGVNHGMVAVGAIGDASYLEFTVIGDSVNSAAKLQNHTKVEGVRALTTRETRDLALRQGWDGARCGETLAHRDVAGVAEPMDVVVLR